MNKCILIGNLTANPQLSTTSNGISLCKFTLAVQRKFETEGTDFINILAWRALAENCNKYLAKGKKAAVVGSLQVRSFDDKNGVKRYVTEIIADEVEFLTPADKPRTNLKPVVDDDLPF